MKSNYQGVHGYHPSQANSSNSMSRRFQRIGHIVAVLYYRQVSTSMLPTQFQKISPHNLKKVYVLTIIESQLLVAFKKQQNESK